MLSSEAARCPACLMLSLRNWLMVKPIICSAKVAAEARAVKGLSRHKPASLLRTSHLFHVPLTAPSSPAFWCLTVNQLNIYALIYICR